MCVILLKLWIQRNDIPEILCEGSATEIQPNIICSYFFPQVLCTAGAHMFVLGPELSLPT